MSHQCYGIRFRENHNLLQGNNYLFGAQCICWIAFLIGFEQEFIMHINYLHNHAVIVNRNTLETSLMPRDIPRDSVDSHCAQANCVSDSVAVCQQESIQQRKGYLSDLLCCTRQSRINALLQSKKQLHRARQ